LDAHRVDRYVRRQELVRHQNAGLAEVQWCPDTWPRRIREVHRTDPSTFLQIQDQRVRSPAGHLDERPDVRELFEDRSEAGSYVARHEAGAPRAPEYDPRPRDGDPLDVAAQRAAANGSTGRVEIERHDVAATVEEEKQRAVGMERTARGSDVDALDPGHLGELACSADVQRHEGRVCAQRVIDDMTLLRRLLDQGHQPTDIISALMHLREKENPKAAGEDIPIIEKSSHQNDRGPRKKNSLPPWKRGKDKGKPSYKGKGGPPSKGGYPGDFPKKKKKKKKGF